MTNEEEIMQPDPDDSAKTSGHWIPEVVLSMLKSSEVSPEGVYDLAMAYPDGTCKYLQVKQWAQAAQQATAREDAQHLARAACTAMLGAAPSELGDEHTFGSYRHCTLIRPLSDRDVFDNVDLDSTVLMLPASSRPSFRLAHEADLLLSSDSVASTTAFSRLIRLLMHWNQIAQFSPDHLTSIEIEQLVRALPASDDNSPTATIVRTVVGAARHAWEEALAARESIVFKGGDHARDLVVNFIGTWLHINPSPEAVNLVTDALLYVQLDDNPSDDEVERRIKRERDHQHQLQRPLTEIQVQHKRIVSLDSPLRVDGADTVRATLAELVPHPVSIHDLVISPDTWEDVRIPVILGRLTPTERAVALAYADGSPLSWDQAAQNCGHDPAFGQRVRCKLKRLGKQLTVRLAGRMQVA